MNSRSGKSVKNLIAYGFNEIVALVNTLLVSRLILSVYGSEYNGLVSSLTQLFLMMGILRSGLYGPMRNALFKPLASHDSQKINGILNATSRYMHKLSIVVAAFILAVAIIFPFCVNSDIDYFEIFLLTIIIGSSYFSQYCFGFTCQILLNADQKIYVYVIENTICIALNCALSITLIYAGASFVIVKAISAIAFFIGPILLSIYCQKKYNLDRKVPPETDAIKQKNDAMGHTVANLVNKKVDIVLISLLCNLKDASIYSVYYIVLNALDSIFNSITNSFASAFGDMWAKDQKDLFQKNFHIFEYLTIAFVAVVLSCTMVLIVPFVNLYTTNVTDVDYNQPLFAFLAVLASIAFCMRVPYQAIVTIIGHYKQTKAGEIMQAVINIVLSLVLIIFFGFIGAIIGTLISNIIRTIQYMHYVRKNVITDSLKVYAAKYTKFVILIALIVGLQYLINSLFTIDGWLVWIGCGAIDFAVASLVTAIYSFVLYKQDFIGLTSIFKAIIPSKKRGTKI